MQGGDEKAKWGNGEPAEYGKICNVCIWALHSWAPSQYSGTKPLCCPLAWKCPAHYKLQKKSLCKYCANNDLKVEALRLFAANKGFQTCTKTGTISLDQHFAQSQMKGSTIHVWIENELKTNVYQHKKWEWKSAVVSFRVFVPMFLNAEEINFTSSAPIKHLKSCKLFLQLTH